MICNHPRDLLSCALLPKLLSHLALIKASHLPGDPLNGQSPHQLPLLGVQGAAQLLLVVHHPVLTPPDRDVAHRAPPLQPHPGKLSPLGQTRINSDKVEIELSLSLSNRI